MSPHNQPILSRALELPPIERAELIEILLSSFELPSRKRIDALWAKEVESRLEAFEKGRIKSIPARDVFKRIDARGQ